MKKILVIDDDEDILVVVKMLLTSIGFEVYTHSSGFDVYDIVKCKNPDLILLDIHLYGKSGTQICKEIKDVCNIPIILFSADRAYGKEFAVWRADAFIEKPFEVKHLLNTINLHLN